MKLQGKTLIIVSVTIISLVMTLSVTSQAILSQSVATTENKTTRKDIETVLAVLSQELSDLNATALDYGAWDDTYAFIQDGNTNYINSNMMDVTFVNLRLSTMLFIDSSGHIVYGKAFDRVNKSEIPVPHSLQEHLTNYSFLLQQDTPESSVAGLLLLPETPILVASRPILTSEWQGPIRGTLIVGRFVDAAEIAYLNQATHLPIAVQVPSSQMPSDFQLANSSLSKENPIFVQPLSRDTVAGYTLLNDISGNPVLMLRIDTPRDLYVQAQISTFYFIVSLIVVGTVFGIVTLLLLERFVLSRLSKLGKDLDKISMSGNFMSRVSVIGEDELSSLAEEINEMLSTLGDAEQNLKDERDRAQKYLDIVGVMVVALDMEGKVVLLNRKGCKTLGTSMANAIGRDWFENFIPARIRDTTQDIFKTVVANGDESYYENPIVTTTGEERLLAWSSAPLRDSDGKIIGALSSGTDITEQRQVEETLRENEEKFRAISASAKDAIILMNGEGRITYWNPGAEQIFGYAGEEVIGRTITGFLIPERFFEGMTRALEEFRKTGRGSMVGKTVELTAIRKDGREFAMELSISTFQMKGDWHALGIARDITERKHMEEQLRESEEKFRGIAERSFAIIAIVDLDGLITYVSPSLERITPYRVEEILGKPFQNLFASSHLSNVLEVFSEISQGKSVEGLEVETSRKDGSSGLFEVNVSPIMVKGEIVGIQAVARDITEKKRMGQALRDNETRLKRITDNMIDMVSQVDMNGIFNYVSPSIKRNLGYDPEDLLGRSVFDFMHPDDVDEVRKTMFESIKTHSWGNMQFRYRHADGHYVWIEGTGNLILDEKGELIGAVFSSRNITKRKHMEEQLRESEEKFRGIAERSFDIIATIDLDGNVTYISSAVQKIMGFSHQEIVGKPFLSYFAPTQASDASQIFETILTGESAQGLEFNLSRKDGTVATVEVNVSPIAVGGRIVGIQGVARDVSDRKQMGEALRETNQRLQKLLETAIEGIAVADPSDNITYANKAFTGMLGYTEDELRRVNFPELVDEKDRQTITDQTNLRKTGQTSRYEIVMHRKDGEPRIVHISASPLWNEDGSYGGSLGIITDITERKQMQQKIMESEERLRLLIEYAPDAIYTSDLNGVFTDGNKRAEILIGYKKEELVGKNMLEIGLLSEKSLPKAMEMLRKNINGQKAGPEELELVKEDGNKIAVESTAFPVRRGQNVEVMGIVRDITERKKAERALAESQQKFERLFKDQPDAAVFADANDHFADVNPRFTEVFGYSLDEVRGKALDDLLAPEDKKKEAQTLTKKSMKGYVYHETVRKKKDGLIIPVSISAAPIIVGGQFAGCVITYKDITERKKMEEALRESEEKIRNVLQSSPNAIVVTNLNGDVIECNQAALDLVSIASKEEVIGKSYFGFIASKHQEKLLEDMSKIMKTNFVKNVDYNFLAKDGREFPAEISLSLIRDVSGEPKYFVAIINDVSERKQMMRKLEEYSQQLEQMVEKRTRQLKEAQEQLVKAERLATIGQVAAMVGHDLRNPLTGINGAAYYLRTRLDPEKNEKLLEMVKLIEKDVQYSNKIVTDLLDYSREIRLELSETTPRAIMEEALFLITVPQNITLVDSTQSEPGMKMDIEKIKRVFSNLIKNAVDAMPHGGKLAIASKKTEANVEFAFADTGIGMTEEVVQKIWTPFFTTKAKGMGLGLPICKRIIEAHGGKISLDTTFGKGTTFTVTIPIEPKTEGGEKIWVNTPESLLSTTTKA